MTHHRQPDAAGGLHLLLAHPLGVLWLLFAAALVGGIVQWTVGDGLPWEGMGAAGVILGVIQLVARVKGIPAWPLAGRRSARSPRQPG